MSIFDDISPIVVFSEDADSDPMATKLRRFQSSPRREKWPGAASHLTPDREADGANFVEHLVKPNETLQGLALQYRSSVIDETNIPAITFV